MRIEGWQQKAPLLGQRIEILDGLTVVSGVAVEFRPDERDRAAPWVYALKVSLMGISTERAWRNRAVTAVALLALISCCHPHPQLDRDEDETCALVEHVRPEGGRAPPSHPKAKGKGKKGRGKGRK